jgi:hypothetical protein
VIVELPHMGQHNLVMTFDVESYEARRRVSIRWQVKKKEITITWWTE